MKSHHDDQYPIAFMICICRFDSGTHQECKEVAHELMMYDDCDDSGLDGESFRSELDSYVYANHYDEHTDDVYTSWQVNRYEMAKKVLKELKNERK